MGVGGCNIADVAWRRDETEERFSANEFRRYRRKYVSSSGEPRADASWTGARCWCCRLHGDF